MRTLVMPNTTIVGRNGPRPGEIIGYRRNGVPIRLIAGAEDNPPAAPDPPAAANADPPQQAQPPDDAAAWKARARHWEQRSKDNAEAARKLAEIEAASQTEAEKAANRLAAAEQRAVEANARANRLHVAIAKGLPAALADRLRGATPEELESDADELKKLLGEKKDPPKTPDFDAGTRGGQVTSARDLGLAEARKRFPKET